METQNRVEIRLTGLPREVEKVAEYLRWSRALQNEGEDQPCREHPDKIVRYLEINTEEKAQPLP